MRHPMQPLQRRVFDPRHELTAYDAMYVALAEALNVPLLTDDATRAHPATTPTSTPTRTEPTGRAHRLHSSPGL